MKIKWYLFKERQLKDESQVAIYIWLSSFRKIACSRGQTFEILMGNRYWNDFLNYDNELVSCTEKIDFRN